MEKKLESTQMGLVVAYYGQRVLIETDQGQDVECLLRRNQVLPVVGDRVIWEMQGDSGIVTGIAERRSALSRADKRGELRPIAANIDFIVVVMAPPPIWSSYSVDRYLIAAHLLGITPLVVINKIDLLDKTTREALATQLEYYAKITQPIIFSSIYESNGLTELNNIIGAKAAVLVGPSGVGKSSIIATLTQSELISIGSVSDKGIGKHTTTATHLYHLPTGGYLIDSPGVREFNLWSISKETLTQAYTEFQPYAGQCKFRNCQHVAEPGCAVQLAVQKGTISAERYANFQELMKKDK